MNITPVAYQQTIGCSIDRSENQDCKPINIPMFKAPPGIKIYLNPNVNLVPINLSLVLRIETDLKLNLVNSKGESVIPNTDSEKLEVHFAQFESNFKKLELNF